MQRQSSTHGPRLDQEMARETKDITRSGHSTHTEEWRQPEPVDEVRQPRPSGPGGPDGPVNDAIQLRSTLASVIGRSSFPADRETLVRCARDANAPSELLDRITSLPAGRNFANVGEVARALGPVPDEGPW
jgi:Protein of unknown function (DUF2795)